MAAPVTAISVSERLLRSEAVTNALTDLRLEDLVPSRETRHLLELYSAGDIGEVELLDRVLRR